MIYIYHWFCITSYITLCATLYLILDRCLIYGEGYYDYKLHIKNNFGFSWEYPIVGILLFPIWCFLILFFSPLSLAFLSVKYLITHKDDD